MDSKTVLVHQHNGKNYVGDSDDCVPIGEYIQMLQATAWDEGFDAGERDVMQHEASNNWDHPCIANPYEED